MEETEKKAFALGLVARELNLDFDELNPQDFAKIESIVTDSLLDEPTSDLGKKMKEIIAKELENKEGEYSKGFNFHKDLYSNKINPLTIFILETLAKYGERLVNTDESVDAEILSEVVSKMNELEYPVGYMLNPFNMVNSYVSRLNAALKGQQEHREDEIKALSIGVKHPKYGTLSPHLASLKDMDSAVKKLRETFNFTEEDYRA